MKLKALLLALFVAGLTASFALAEDGGHGKGKPAGAGAPAAKAKADCRPSFAVNLAGTVAAAPSADSFALAVTKGNAHGKKLAGKQVTVDASKAKVVRKGKKTVADLAAGDRVLVKARACVDLAEGTVSISARQVVVLGAAKPKPSDETTSSTTTTSGS